MNVASLHSPLVRRAIETINEGRLDDFLALFARDATVIDGATYHGAEAIRAWAKEKRLGCRCILTWYKKRIRRELLSR